MHRLFLAAFCLLICAFARAQEHPYLLLERGRNAATEGKLDLAAEEFSKAALRLPNGPTPFLRLAEVRARQGKKQEAISALERAARLGAVANLSVEPFSALPVPKELRERFAENARPVNAGRVVAVLAEKDLIPENVAVHDGALYVGSMYRAKIARLDRDGSVSDFVRARSDNLFSVLGMKIDPQKKELWVNSCNIGDDPPMFEPVKESVGQAAVHRYDLATGKLVKRYTVEKAPAKLCFNDLVMTPSREVFLTAGGDGIFRIDPATEKIELYASPRGSWFNGIAASADGTTLFLADHFDGVVRFDLASKTLSPISVPDDLAFGGVDGLYVYENSLVAIQNGLREIPARVVQAFLSDDMNEVTDWKLLERAHPLYNIPTTGAISGNSLVYVANSQLDSFTKEAKIWPMEKLDKTYLLELPLERRSVPSSSKLASLSWMSGHWTRTEGTRTTEETWSAPSGALMVATHRAVRPGKKAWFEFLRIEETSEGVAYIAMPGGRPPTAFPMIESSAGRVVFAKPDHDFPQRIIYWRSGEQLCARTEGMIKGKMESEEWCWDRTR